MAGSGWDPSPASRSDRAEENLAALTDESEIAAANDTENESDTAANICTQHGITLRRSFGSLLGRCQPCCLSAGPESSPDDDSATHKIPNLDADSEAVTGHHGSSGSTGDDETLQPNYCICGRIGLPIHIRRKLGLIGKTLFCERCRMDVYAFLCEMCHVYFYTSDKNPCIQPGLEGVIYCEECTVLFFQSRYRSKTI